MRFLLVLFLIAYSIFSQTSYRGEAKLVFNKNITRLKVNLDNGYIRVDGWEKPTIEIYAYQKNRLSEDKKLKFILIESGKTLQLYPEDQSGFYTYDIFVPAHLDLNLTIHNNGFVSVHNSSGEVEANTSSGNIRLTELNGSAIINSQTGTIFADFKELKANQNMAFSNSYGSVYLSFPEQSRVSFNISTIRGKAYSDFKLTVPSLKNDGTQTIESDYLPLNDGRITGLLNGGGVLIPIHTLSGDIYIEKLLIKNKGATHASN